MDPVVVKAAFDLVADAFDVGPGAFDVQRVVEVELLMDHAHAVVRPHVEEAVLAELACAIVKVAVAHVAV